MSLKSHMYTESMNSEITDRETIHKKGSFIKKALLNFITGLLLFIGHVVLYIVLGFTLGNLRTQGKESLPSRLGDNKDHIIYLETNGVHVDFIIPNEYILNDPFLSHLIQPGYNFTAIGWGDKAFYLETPQWEDLTAKNFCRALFWKSDSLMHVSPYYQEQDHWIPVHLNNKEVQDLNQFITQSFMINENTPEVFSDFSYYGDDRFYNAHGSYTLFYTCNNWVNEGLSEIGESTSLWSPFDKPILEHTRRNHEAFVNSLYQ